MNIINFCGKRGLGDLVASTSELLLQLEVDTHIIYWLPDGFDYENTINVILTEFTENFHLKISWEVNCTWSTIRPYQAEEKFGKENFMKTWYFGTGDTKTGYYVPFKTQWKGNKDGPIILLLNNENYSENYPAWIRGKFFTDDVNQVLLDLVDNNNYVMIGRPKSLEKSIEMMANCRYMVGFDGGFTHIACCMNVPQYLVINKAPARFLKMWYRKYNCIKLVETHQVFDFLL